MGAHRKRNVAAVAAVALLIVALVGPVRGDLLRDDDGAMAEWQGFATFFSTDGARTLNVEVDYAVYASGLYPGEDPSGGEYCVYAYEILNAVNDASVEVSTLTVGLVAGSGANHVGTDTGGGAPGRPGGVEPVSGTIGSSSARWFFPDGVAYSQDSVTLLFTSPNLPQWMSGSVVDGGLSNVQPLPSPSLNPVPEPATLALLGLGAMSLMAAWRRRCR